MNPTTALAYQPTPVLVALFNSIAFKKLKTGDIDPACIKICKILNKRGYDINKLDYSPGNRKQDNSKKSGKNEKGS